MNDIVHCRVDFRLIHGQVVTKWLKSKNAEHILIVDDELANDDFLGMVYKMAAPAGYKVSILTVEGAISELKKESKLKTFVLFKDIKTANQAFVSGFYSESIQIGGLEGKPGKSVVFHHFPVDITDCNLLLEVESYGVKVYFQTVPGEKEIELSSVVQKIKEKK